LADKTLFFYGFMGENSLEVGLRELMATAQITSWQQLSHQTGISIKRLRTLRRRSIDQWQLAELRQLSQVFQMPLVALLEQLGTKLSENQQPTLSALQITSMLQAIESFLTYWPAAVHQVQLNPNFPASKLLPLIKPIDRLVASWDVLPLDTVGTVLPFNPQQHQAIDGQISAGEMVMIRYPGYQQGGKLLWRSQVSCL
jgi:hypothetical protein